MEISCEHVWREVSNYLDADVDAGLRAAIEEHVQGCKHCAAVLDGTRNVVQLIGDHRVLEIPAGFDQRLRGKMEHGGLGGKRQIVPPRRSAWLVWAGTAALLLGAFALATSRVSHDAPLRAEMAHPASTVPASLTVYVADDGKTFHVKGCRFLHDPGNSHSLPADAAIRAGYSPCIYCMKQYLSTGGRPQLDREGIIQIAGADHIRVLDQPAH